MDHERARIPRPNAASFQTISRQQLRPRIQAFDSGAVLEGRQSARAGSCGWKAVPSFLIHLITIYDDWNAFKWSSRGADTIVRVCRCSMFKTPEEQFRQHAFMRKLVKSQIMASRAA